MSKVTTLLAKALVAANTFITITLPKYRKAAVPVVTTVIAVVTLVAASVPALAPVVVALTGLATTLGVRQVANDQ